MKVFQFSLKNKDIKQTPLFNDAIVIAKTEDAAAAKLRKALDGKLKEAGIPEVVVGDITEIGIDGETVHLSCVDVDYVLEYLMRGWQSDETERG